METFRLDDESRNEIVKFSIVKCIRLRRHRQQCDIRRWSFRLYNTEHTYSRVGIIVGVTHSIRLQHNRVY